jgi:hypothetical protein
MIVGALEGFISSLPQGQLIKYCGRFTLAFETALKDAYDLYVEKRDLSLAMEKIYFAMRLTALLTNTCYYGAKSYILGEGFVKLFTEFDIFVNIGFNFGYMWIDMIMLSTQWPGNTNSDYFYFVFFYLFDFVGRFLFRETSTENCWYPWSTCSSTVSTSNVSDYDLAILGKFD